MLVAGFKPVGGVTRSGSIPPSRRQFADEVGARASVARPARRSAVCPGRVGTALIPQPLGGTEAAQDGLAPPGSRAGQRCADALPKLLWCAHWRLGAGLADLGPKEG